MPVKKFKPTSAASRVKSNREAREVRTEEEKVDDSIKHKEEVDFLRYVEAYSQRNCKTIVTEHHNKHHVPTDAKIGVRMHHMLRCAR